VAVEVAVLQTVLAQLVLAVAAAAVLVGVLGCPVLTEQVILEAAAEVLVVIQLEVLAMEEMAALE
jgi:hypothetical protein